MSDEKGRVRKRSRTDAPLGWGALWEWFLRRATLNEFHLLAGFFNPFYIKRSSSSGRFDLEKAWKDGVQHIEAEGLINELSILIEALWHKKQDVLTHKCVNWTKVNVALGMDFQLLRLFATAPELHYREYYESPTKEDFLPGLHVLRGHKFNLEYKSIEGVYSVEQQEFQLRAPLRMSIGWGRAQSQKATWAVRTLRRPNETPCTLWYGMESLIRHRLVQHRPSDWPPPLWQLVADFASLPH